MKYLIHIQTESNHSKYHAQLTQIANATLTYIAAPIGELTLVLGNEDQIQELNRKFRNIDQPTDVLSFKDDLQDPDSGIAYFGDVIVAVPIAEAQAMSAGHSIEAELSLLVVHGILHLFDYDHSTEVEEEEMWEIQSQILDLLIEDE